MRNRLPSSHRASSRSAGGSSVFALKWIALVAIAVPLEGHLTGYTAMENGLFETTRQLTASGRSFLTSTVEVLSSRDRMLRGLTGLSLEFEENR